MKHIPTYAFGDNRLPERFWRKVTVDTGSGCWVWMGARTSGGYGSVGWNGGVRSVHRLAYEKLAGEIPDGLTIDHVAARGCIHKTCVNPSHLEPVTAAENGRRQWDVRGRVPEAAPKSWDQTFIIQGEPVTRPFRTHCPRGHEYTEGNTYVSLIRKTGAVSRQCKTCLKHRAKHGVYPEPVAPSVPMATPMAHIPVDTEAQAQPELDLTTVSASAPSGDRNRDPWIKRPRLGVCW